MGYLMPVGTTVQQARRAADRIFNVTAENKLAIRKDIDGCYYTVPLSIDYASLGLLIEIVHIAEVREY